MAAAEAHAKDLQLRIEQVGEIGRWRPEEGTYLLGRILLRYGITVVGG